MTVVFLLYSMLRHRAQNVMLLGASYVFYGFWDWRFLSLLIGSAMLVYLCALAIGRSENERTRNALALLAVGILLAILGLFKYLGFFAQSFADLLAVFGLKLGWVGINLILPVGISFYTFQAIGYVIDVRNRRIKPVDDFVELALFVSFFPLLLSGPIERATHLLPQIQQARAITLDNFTRGAYLILFGLFKKVVIADGLSSSVDPVFASRSGYSAMDVIIVAYLYSLQLYCDFSGYSDVARGVARMLGFSVMKNFMTPFFSKSPSEYWSRWHISLSSWVRDYVYFPLALHFFRKGESKLNEAKPHVYAMLLMGLWHGASWTYILWGAYHGLMLVLWSMLKWPKGLRSFRKRIPGVVWMIVYFHVTLVSLIIFRAVSLSQLGDFIALLWTPGAAEVHVARPPIASLLAAPIFLALDIAAFHNRSELFYRDWHPAIRGALYAILFTLLLMGLSNGAAQFIYFQF